MDFRDLDAVALAAKIRRGQISAGHVATAALDRIGAIDPRINAFTSVTAARALEQARGIDQAVAAGTDPGPLAGVPFAAKNLFDIAGVTTIAGSTIRRSCPPATEDATIIRRLCAAGAVLCGATNMDEFAYGLTTENTHYGATRNPHDTGRTAGGSSGGSAAAVAAGLVLFALGTDTGGSIRVPASLCGLFGLKPSFGRLPRTGTALFAPSIDHVGPLARSVRDLALVYDLMQGGDAADPFCVAPKPVPVCDRLPAGVGSLRLAVAGGYFRRWATEPARDAVDRVARHLGVEQEVDLPRPDLARAAAYVIGAVEGAALHHVDLRRHLDHFDPNTRGRFLAGALLPAGWYVKAQQFRRWLNEAIDALFSRCDILLAPATPCTATLLGQEKIGLGGELLPTRPSLGLMTQPFSATGLAIVTVPLATAEGLPIGVQVIAAPFREEAALRVAYVLERDGVAQAQIQHE